MPQSPGPSPDWSLRLTYPNLRELFNLRCFLIFFIVFEIISQGWSLVWGAYHVLLLNFWKHVLSKTCFFETTQSSVQLWHNESLENEDQEIAQKHQTSQSKVQANKDFINPSTSQIFVLDNMRFSMVSAFLLSRFAPIPCRSYWNMTRDPHLPATRVFHPSQLRSQPACSGLPFLRPWQWLLSTHDEILERCSVTFRCLIPQHFYLRHLRLKSLKNVSFVCPFDASSFSCGPSCRSHSRQHQVRWPVAPLSERPHRESTEVRTERRTSKWRQKQWWWYLPARSCLRTNVCPNVSPRVLSSLHTIGSWREWSSTVTPAVQLKKSCFNKQNNPKWKALKIFASRYWIDVGPDVGTCQVK